MQNLCEFYRTITGKPATKEKELYEDAEIFKYAEFENKVRYNHCHEKLCKLDDDLRQLEIDLICTELDIDIAETVEDTDDVRQLKLDLEQINSEINKLNELYEIVMDFYDAELIEGLESYRRITALNNENKEIFEKVFG